MVFFSAKLDHFVNVKLLFSLIWKGLVYTKIKSIVTETAFNQFSFKVDSLKQFVTKYSQPFLGYTILVMSKNWNGLGN